MSDVGPGESGARRAVAVGIERARIVAVLGTLDVQTSVVGKDGAVPSHPCRRDAIEQIDASPDALYEILGEADAHEVPRMGFGESFVDDFDHLVHRVFFFADRESADAEAGPVVHRSDRLARFATQVGVDAALNYRKECWVERGDGGGGMRDAGGGVRDG